MSLASSAPSQARNQSFSWSFAWPWVLGFGLIVYLGLEGGGFDPLVNDQVGIAAWWVLLFAVAVGALPRRTPTTLAWSALGLFACFACWTALSLLWTESNDKTMADLARIATYVGVFGLALFTRGPDGVRHTVTAVAAAVAFLSLIALLSRLHPAWFPESASQTGAFLETGRERLSYPLNYWNALAALIAIGAPLILYLATCAKQLWVRGLAAAVCPALALAAFLTLSRAGIASGVLAIAIFLALTPDRLPKALTLLVTGIGGGILVLIASKQSALVHGFANSTAHDQGDKILLLTLAIGAVVGLTQVAISHLLSRGRPAWTRVPRQRSQVALGTAIAVVLVAALAVGVPGKVSNAWSDFKQPSSGPGFGTERLGSIAGESRYQFWSSSVRGFEQNPLTGTGSGTFEIWWPQDGDNNENVVDTHSLYLQTLGELGIVGFALLVAFAAVCLVGGTARVLRRQIETRPAYAAALAGSTAIWVTSILDWTWKVPVLPIAALLLTAALLTSGGAGRGSERRRFPLALRIAIPAAALAAIVAIAIPLASTSLVRQSQAEARAGDLQSALDHARTAQNVEPAAAAPRLQQALVLESAGDFEAAGAAIAGATAKEPHNWRIWLVRSRIEAERGHAAAAVGSYRTARSLNPYGRVFEQD